MNAKEIVGKHFEKAAFNGYRTEDVDEYLREISEEFSKLQRENGELERKLEVLADKIREYRNDEEALKDALLIAQKQGNAIIAESKSIAEQLTRETNETVEKQLAEAKEKSENTIRDADEYAEKTRREAEENAEKIVSEAQSKADEIKALMEKHREVQENILQQTRKEVIEYRQRILNEYNEHIKFIESLPEKCENEYVIRTAAEVEKREEERANKAAEEKKAANIVPQKKEAVVKKEEKPAEKAASEPVKQNKEEKKVDDKTTESNLPFFNSNTAESKSLRHSDLKFGKNNGK